MIVIIIMSVFVLSATQSFKSSNGFLEEKKSNHKNNHVQK